MFGLISTPPEVRPWGLLGATNAAVPDEYLAMSSLAMRGGNQIGTESCVGWALAGVCHVAAALRGVELYPSPSAIYWAARKRTGGAMLDVGSRPDDACFAVQEMGIVPWARWPFEAARIDDEPPWDALDSALDWQRFALRRIVSAGSYRSADVRRALSSRRPVMIGQAVDREYMRSQGVPWTRTGEIIGRHAECVIGYSTDGVWTVSSWGDDDRCVSWEQLESDDVTDLWAGEWMA